MRGGSKCRRLFIAVLTTLLIQESQTMLSWFYVALHLLVEAGAARVGSLLAPAQSAGIIAHRRSTLAAATLPQNRLPMKKRRSADVLEQRSRTCALARTAADGILGKDNSPSAT
jgi:hypothetical protein